jgi:hypothetical protein
MYFLAARMPFNANFDTALEVRSGPLACEGESLGCNDDSLNTNAASLSLNMTAGQVVTINYAR